MFLSLALLVSGPATGSTVARTVASPAVDCDTSAFWKRVDESALDRPSAGQRVAVTVGCTFVGPPGAILDLALGAHTVSGLEVVGIRRGSGQVMVDATPEAAEELARFDGIVATTTVRGGDWGPLLEEVERARRSR
ncbi:MAG: hypothetical protein ACI8PZ_002449 [Myxococcota bacterium]|jgi:hypothetical protein